MDVAQGHVDSRPQLLTGHMGAVSCLLLAEQEGLGLEGHLLLSGGADRTIRVWDPAIKDLDRDPGKACVQTLRGHGGTVSSLAFCDGVLVSTSTDHTIQVLQPEPEPEPDPEPEPEPEPAASRAGPSTSAAAASPQHRPSARAPA